LTAKHPFDQPLRPLAQLVPHADGDALVFTTPDREVRVEGDPRLVGEVLSRCDGLRTADESAQGFGDGLADEVARLLQTLAEHEVVVDSTQAYRLFHDRSTVRSGLFREIGETELETLTRQSFEPRGLLERRERLQPSTGALLDLTTRRSSARPGEQRAISYPELSTVLTAMYRLREEGRPVPSAGSLYPLAIHTVIREPVFPLDPGLWWYDPCAEALRLLHDAVIDLEDLMISQPTTDPLVAAGQPVVLVSADLQRAASKYSNRGYRYALMEVGAAMQNAYLAAAELGLPIRAIGGFHDDAAHELLDLPVDVAPLLALLLGA
jgi:SagB-type dehydrogenase family enzyme